MAAVHDPRNQASNLAETWGSPSNKTWGQEFKAYENFKRHDVNPSTMKAPDLFVHRGLVSNEERRFDPIRQRYRDPELEANLRRHEKEYTLEHLNRARDIQILREQKHDIIHNGSKIHALEEDKSPNPQRSARSAPSSQDKNGSMVWPDSCQGRVDYNIISNLGFDVHHFDHHHERPRGPQRIPRSREVAAYLQRDFNIISNRYVEDHDAKAARNHELAKLECTAKNLHTNRFHPLLQKYMNQDEENRMQVMDDIHTQEIMKKAEENEPPSSKYKATSYYNPVSGQMTNEGMLKWMDLAEDERKLRYRSRHFMEHDIHNRDMAHDHADEQRKLNRMHFDRYRTHINRGHCIISNQHFEGRGGVAPHVPYHEPKPSPWADAMARNGLDNTHAPEAHLGSEVLRRTQNVTQKPPASGQADVMTLTPRQGGSVAATPRTPQASRSSREPARPRPLESTPRLTPRVFPSSAAAPPPPSVPGGSHGGAVYSQAL